MVESAPSIFQREGLDVFSLTLGRHKHLPAEIADNLTEADARRIVTKLDILGAVTRVVPMHQVTDVRLRAAEAWADRIARGFHFNEIDGMILAGGALNVRENLELRRQESGFSPGWRYERGNNHHHPDLSRPARERVRQENQMLLELEAALGEAYPAVRFVLSHIPGHSISFWQYCDQCAHLGVSLDGPKYGKVWCQECERNQPYRTIPTLDPDFPQAEWGTCAVCGTDVLVRVWEVLRVIGPDRALSGP